MSSIVKKTKLRPRKNLLGFIKLKTIINNIRNKIIEKRNWQHKHL